MYEIEITNLQTFVSLEPGWIEGIVRQTLAAEQVEWAEVAVAVLDDDAIHAVNREHLQHDYPTDVISFLYEAWPKREHHSNATGLRGSGLSLDGEVLVSAETALRMSQQMDWSPQAEITLYLVHGLLHLCGYDDLTQPEQQIMRARERDILQNWNLMPHYQA